MENSQHIYIPIESFKMKSVLLFLLIPILFFILVDNNERSKLYLKDPDCRRCDPFLNLSQMHPVNNPVYKSNICRHEVNINPRDLQFQEGDSNEQTVVDAPYISDDVKLMLCWIPKNSCTKFKQLMLRLQGHGDDWKRITNVHASNPSMRANRYPSWMLNALSTDSMWKRLAILRDPMERFVSGYMDKVVNECWFKPANNGICFNASIKDFSRFLLSDVWMDNDHFAFQWRFCGFDKYPWIWTDIILYNEQSIAKSASEVLRSHVNNSILSSGWENGAMFSSRIGHETSGSKVKAQLVRELCHDEALFRQFMDKLQTDYVFFNFPASSLCQLAM